ncbi:hypothetical protein VaNZ11_005786 [Volvox africanus]|uniref:Nudix hydrolase domain-containing protein n=1 Tax=Volvox africanus TaxID=51714 RepID=A0ABQ5RZU4_9CHLO|nr:hypothetical protein VaNZ11_005786 [Volvox africanus]
MWSLGSSLHLTRRVLSSCRQARRALSSLTTSQRHINRYACYLLQQPADYRTSSTTATGSDSCTGKSRAYPTEPRVGVGVVVFRTQPVQGRDSEVLLVRRAKDPDKDRWCFPGGSLELGETLAACAAREVEEETGLRLCGGVYGTAGGSGHVSVGTAAPVTAVDGAAQGMTSTSTSAAAVAWASSADSWSLTNGPIPFAAVDVISRDADGRIQFHYAVIEVAALCSGPDAVPISGDDADGVQWVPVSRLRHMPDLTVRCDEMVEEALRRFAVADSRRLGRPNSEEAL